MFRLLTRACLTRSTHRLRRRVAAARNTPSMATPPLQLLAISSTPSYPAPQQHSTPHTPSAGGAPDRQLHTDHVMAAAPSPQHHAATPSPFLATDTSQQQHELEVKVAALYEELAECVGTSTSDSIEDSSSELQAAAGVSAEQQQQQQQRAELLVLLRDRHARYLAGGLGQLPAGFVSLAASRPWICYWALHGLALLEAPLPRDISAAQVVAFLSSCQHPQGGYGGGPGQMAHLAPTYAAVSALVTLGGNEALASIDRLGVWGFLCRMAVPPEQGGGFRMHDGGESDVRSCYTAMAVATHLRLDVSALVARSGMVDYVQRCQTYEGGIGGEPGNEAHGGYTFCGLAALLLAGRPRALDLPRLLHWAAQRQGWVEGGFNGRTNKLVDGCYSFWQGGVFPLLQELLLQAQHEGGGGTAGGEQSQHHLGACCSSTTYPPSAPPSHWHEQQEQEQQEVVVPALPDLSRVQAPVEQADQEAQRLNAVCEALAEAVLADPAMASSRQQGPAAGAAGTVPHETWHQLLQRAQAAQRAAEYAEEGAHIAAASAAVLFPCAAGTGEQQQQEAWAGSGPAEPAPNPLFNTHALQCWILRVCQQLKGGLRDKPGKPADYYHSCYCLSGLAVAQHIPGSDVLGPALPGAGDGDVPAGVQRSRGNELVRADPVLNVVVDRLRDAQAYFGGGGAA